ncbi:MAG TPA: FAD-binding protein, partial [Actinomycetota bacterium]|nr:FAD-binding protein [Actinomycetota bacterium]
MAKKTVQPAWRETKAREGSYRAAFRFEPPGIKHPSAGWVQMFKDEFGMTDTDFVAPRTQGDEQVTLDGRPGMGPEHRAAIVAIVGADNVQDDDFSRVRYGHGKALDENLALRAGRVGAVPDLVVHPRHKQDVAEIVGYCAQHRIPVVPYGAGSGVVVGTRADRGG